MGNLVGFTKKGKVSIRQVWSVLPGILEKRFPGVFDAMPMLGTGIRIFCKDCPDLQWEWWQDGNRVWGKYPHYGEVGYWVHAVFLDEVGAKIGCRLFSEGCPGTWVPVTGRYKTFREYFESKKGYLPSEEKSEALKLIWLDVVKQIPAVLLPFAGDTGPL